MEAVLNLILTHQPSGNVHRMLDYWRGQVRAESILVGYGGPRTEFERIEHAKKFFVDDPRLRTRDHPREFQSYTGLLQQAAEFLKTEGGSFGFVHFSEYDHVPLVPDLNARQMAQLESEAADALAFHLHRVDGTNGAHFLYHSHNERFADYWKSISLRKDKGVVLSIVGSGSFWTREAFLAVTSLSEPFPMYLELYLPTLAHHLGFRVRGFGEAQDQFVHVLGDRTDGIDGARAAGAWTLHPVKHLWDK